MKQPRSIIVTGANSDYFQLLLEMTDSLREHRTARGIPLGIFDFGLSETERTILRDRAEFIVQPTSKFGIHCREGWGNQAYESRLFMPEYFPGYDVYVWMDCDAWLQRGDALDKFVSGAVNNSAAVVAEIDPDYRIGRRHAFRVLKTFVRGYGWGRGLWLYRKPHFNVGVFAIHVDAPHWSAWQNRALAAIRRTRTTYPHDQFAFNQAVYQDILPVEILPSEFNYIVGMASPVWDPERQCFLTADATRELAIVHLAGEGPKAKNHHIPVMGGGTLVTHLRYPDLMALRATTQPRAPAGVSSRKSELNSFSFDGVDVSAGNKTSLAERGASNLG